MPRIIYRQIADRTESKDWQTIQWLNVLHSKNVRPEKKVELRLVVNVGSILEDDDQQGLAHFTEHMAFNGTKNFKKNDLVSFLQTIGVEFGADLNAYTD
jgi:predicted Zn-dependent peptidase